MQCISLSHVSVNLSTRIIVLRPTPARNEQVSIADEIKMGQPVFSPFYAILAAVFQCIGSQTRLQNKALVASSLAKGSKRLIVSSLVVKQMSEDFVL